MEVHISQLSRWENGESFPELIGLLKLSILYRTFPSELYEDLFLLLKGEIEKHFLIADE